MRHLPGAHQPAGDQLVIEESFEYDGDFGCGTCGFNFVTRHTDGRGNAVLNAYDDRGNLVARTNRIASVVDQWEYDNRGRMTKHVHPDNGSGHRQVDLYSYYESGPMRGYLKEEIDDATGFALKTTYEYDLFGNLTRRTDPRGFDTQYVVNALNQVVREISPEVLAGSGIRYTRDYHFDANNNLVRMEVENRRELLLDNGAPFQSEVGRSLGFPAADGGIVATNSTWTTHFEYDILNYLVRKREEVEPDRFIATEYAYDGNRNLVLTQFGEATAGRQPNNAVAMLYDERDLPFREVRAPGDPQQSSTQHDYDVNRNRIRTWEGLEADPHLTTYTYDGFNRQVSMTDPMGNVTTNQYDATGNRVLTLVLGELDDGPGSTNNVRLSETHFGYDALNRITNQAVAFFNATNQVAIDDGWATTQTLYTDRSRVLALINDNGHGRTNRYDTAGRLHQIVDAKGNTTTLDHDPNGNPVTMTEVEKSDLAGQPPTPFPGTGPNGSVIPYVPQPAQLGLDETFVTTYAYDSHNRLIATTDGSGNVNRSAYDSRDNRTRTVDALTNVVHITFDGLGRELDTIREMVDHVGVPPLKPTITTRQAWDDSSRLITQTDDNGNATTYVHDPLNRKYSTVFADGTGQTNWLDLHGNPVIFTDANQNWVTNRYDDLDRLVRRDVTVGPGVSDDTTWEDYRYDGLSRLTYAADDDSVVIRNFDSLGQVRQDIQGTNVVGAVYDAVGNQTELHYPSGRLVVTTYDELERKRRITDRVEPTSEQLIAQYWYAGPNGVTRRDYGNGTVSLWQYDGIVSVDPVTGAHGFRRATRSSQIRLADSVLLDDRQYVWDAVMNRTRDARLNGRQPQLAHDYQYDSAHRLVRFRVLFSGEEQLTVNYHLDGVGNRRSVIGGPLEGSYVMDSSHPEPADRQRNLYSSSPWDLRRSDANGNLIRISTDIDHSRNFQYDYRNRMTGSRVSPSDRASWYGYDPLDRRVAKRLNGEPSKVDSYYYDQWMEIEQWDAVTSQPESLILGLHIDDGLALIRSASRFYFVADNVATVVAILGEDGELLERVEYAEFGALAPKPLLQTTYLFAGHRFDPESNLYLFRSRFLDPLVGRFTTVDRLGVWEGDPVFGSALSYAGNNPATWTDPYGTFIHNPYPPRPRRKCEAGCPIPGKLLPVGHVLSHTTEVNCPQGTGKQTCKASFLCTAEDCWVSIYLKCKPPCPKRCAPGGVD